MKRVLNLGQYVFRFFYVNEDGSETELVGLE